MDKDYFEKIKGYKLIANKSLGQNFLINPDTAKKIVDLLEINEKDKVLEIGAGLGSLSYFLAKSPGFSELIDVDERMLLFLNEAFSSMVFSAIPMYKFTSRTGTCRAV